MTQSITIPLQILTPMFAGSALPGSCELRTQSIKGALRFWWRALQADPNWKDMLKRENQIFGGTGKGEGRSIFSIQVSGNPNIGQPDLDQCNAEVNTQYGSGKIKLLPWLAYGPADKGEFEAPAFVEDQSFQLTFHYQDAQAMEVVWEALATWARFSGLGSNHRNGWGKVWISQWPHAIERPETAFPSSPMVAYTAFSQEAAYFETSGKYDHWDHALAEVATIYYKARKALAPKKKAPVPSKIDPRIFLSQPLQNSKTKQQLSFLERHGKSLFMGIRPEGHQFKGQVLILPYLYLDQTHKSQINAKIIRRALAKDRAEYDRVYAHLIKQFQLHLKQVQL